MTGPYDGKKVEYVFGMPNCTWRWWKVSTTSLKKAIRAFRVGALHPHTYSTKPVWDQWGPSYDHKTAVDSEPGAVVIVRVSTAKGPWEEVARIPPDAPLEEDLDGAMRDATKHLSGAIRGVTGETTALAVASEATGLANASRADIDKKVLCLQHKMGELERVKADLELQKNRMIAELKRRMEEIWMIELFLGSKEEVKVLRRGEPAPAGTRITARQSILCMDEEIAVHDWLNNPERIGQFDYQDLDAFDDWLLADSSNLEAIFPHEKGVVGLRVRRYAKNRNGAAYAGIGGAFRAMHEEKLDAMTYLLVRNGENLYRLWVDVNMWPRLFSSEKDFKKKDPFSKEIKDLSPEEARNVQKKFFAGLLVIQGLIERSDLFHPLPRPGLSVVNPEHAEHFELVRDGESHNLLADPDNPFGTLIWPNYRAWLLEQINTGVRCLWTGKAGWGEGRLHERTGIKTVNSWPKRDEAYVVERVATSWRGHDFKFKYLPDDDVWDPKANGGWGEYLPRTRRVSFGCYSDELLPIDFMSWRVLEHLLRDRASRPHYRQFFRAAFSFWKDLKARSERERPFIDLVLVKAGVELDNEQERARAERVLRWWKLKTKEHRTLGTDEAKALRMVSKAFEKGEDFENDPERLLFKKS